MYIKPENIVATFVADNIINALKKIKNKKTPTDKKIEYPSRKTVKGLEQANCIKKITQWARSICKIVHSY